MLIERHTSLARAMSRIVSTVYMTTDEEVSTMFDKFVKGDISSKELAEFMFSNSKRIHAWEFSSRAAARGFFVGALHCPNFRRWASSDVDSISSDYERIC